MKIAYVTSEIFPYAKTGGLGDVAGSLPIELSNLGAEVKLFMPGYTTITKKEFDLHSLPELGEINIRIADRDHVIHVFTSTLPNSTVPVYFVDCPYYFGRYEIYTSDPDEDERFILFSKSVIEIIQRLKWSPDIIHCNEWQTGLIPIYLKGNYAWDRLFEKTKTVFTIHNIAYQGKFPKESIAKAEIQHDFLINSGVCEYFGEMNFLKTAILTADAINTVSETYAQELLTTESGAGMEQFLEIRKNDFCGILNGVDYSIWNPEFDHFIPHKYSSRDLSNKMKNKRILLQRFNLPYRKNIPVIGMISRLVEQKGFDLISEGVNDLMKLNARWVILGNGNSKYEKLIKTIVKKYPKKISACFSYNEELAHLIKAGADIFLMPSRYEPCGLNQIYSLKYGTVPVVRKTGGLADTVQDWNESIAKGKETGTGFSFSEYNVLSLVQTLRRTLNMFEKKSIWAKIQLNGMRKDFSWKKSADKYVLLYEKAVSKIKRVN
ncbi:MAG: glycogen synthase GlgA [Ignavibacteriales bacterium]|nr:glycogen synthase GlgA [Ignavibacteriales bacterium]